MKAGKSVTLLASATRTSSGAGTAVTGLRGFRGGTFMLSITDAATAAGDTLNVYVQRLLPNGTSWDDIVSFTQVLGNGADTLTYVADVIFDSQASDERVAADGSLAAGTVSAVAFGDSLRVKYTIASADTPSFTFSVTADLFN